MFSSCSSSSSNPSGSSAYLCKMLVANNLSNTLGNIVIDASCNESFRSFNENSIFRPKWHFLAKIVDWQVSHFAVVAPSNLFTTISSTNIFDSADWININFDSCDSWATQGCAVECRLSLIEINILPVNFWLLHHRLNWGDNCVCGS